MPHRTGFRPKIRDPRMDTTAPMPSAPRESWRDLARKDSETRPVPNQFPAAPPKSSAEARTNSDADHLQVLEAVDGLMRISTVGPVVNLDPPITPFRKTQNYLLVQALIF